MRTALFLALCCLLFSSAAWSAPAAPAGATLAEQRSAGPFEMRGFGRVSAEGYRWTNPAASLVIFTAEDAAKAGIVAAKYYADLQNYGAVTPRTLAGLPSAVEVRHGGLFLVGVDGAQAKVAWAGDEAALRKVATTWGAAQWQPVTAKAYPRFLDCFDNAAFGLWWMPGTKPQEVMDFAKSLPAIVSIHQQRLALSYAPGVYDTHGSDNVIAQAKLLDRPYRFMLWAAPPDWWQPSAAHDTEEFPAGFTGRRFHEAGGYYATQMASERMNLLQQDVLINIMRRFAEDPNVVGWMEPHGEFHITVPPGVPPGYQTRYPAYLRTQRGYTLASLSTAYTGNAKSYTAWEQVPYPDIPFFRGRRGHYLDLDTAPWRWKKETQEAGRQQGFWREDFDDATWGSDLRNSARMLSNFVKDIANDGAAGTWFRFTQDISAASLAAMPPNTPVYLHIMPVTDKDGRRLSAWVNGVEVLTDAIDNAAGAVNDHMQVDVRAHLRAGQNRFVIYNQGGRIAYRVFLSDTGSEEYPFSDARLNRRWLDWRQYLIWEKLQILERYLRVMRSVDPNRPIKVMTPHLFQSDALDLFAKYGAYPQLTGEGAFYRPMHYKGYSRLRDLPASSEFGGPPHTRFEAQRHIAMLLAESQDAHDYVFDPQRDIWPYKEVVQWLQENTALLATIGKTNFPTPAVGVLRDTQQDALYANGEIWSGDLSRGMLPSAGIIPVLVDGPDMDKGLADKLPVLFDCSTVVMTEKRVQAIQRYIENGGTYIAQYNTGRHTPDQRDQWPLAKAFGFTVKPQAINDEVLSKWPQRPLAFTAEESLFPGVRGQQLFGCGFGLIPKAGLAVTPIARWEDGSLAVAELRYGKGTLIYLASPVHLRLRRDGNRWLSEEERQRLFEELLTVLQVPRETRVSTPKLWADRRVSKNGLYDVLFAGYASASSKADPREVLRATVGLAQAEAKPAIETTRDGAPDVPTTFAQGCVDVGEQAFEPFQIRQFAVVRDHVGLESPFTWLQEQRGTWRALEPVPATLAEDIEKAAAPMKSAGLDISDGWKMRVDPADRADAAWTQPAFDDTAWQPGKSGSWLALGIPHATCVQYRQTVTIPAAWTKSGRILLGFNGWLGISGKGKLWVNGQPSGIDDQLSTRLVGTELDVTQYLVNGRLPLALEVESTTLDRGIIGSIYLRHLPTPLESIPLDGAWTQLAGWDQVAGPIKLPIMNKQVFGLRYRVQIPASWAGREVRLVIDNGKGLSVLTGVAALIINSTGYLTTDNFAPQGTRIDRWLQPGAVNEIDFYGKGHTDKKYTQFRATIPSARLELLP